MSTLRGWLRGNQLPDDEMPEDNVVEFPGDIPSDPEARKAEFRKCRNRLVEMEAEADKIVTRMRKIQEAMREEMKDYGLRSEIVWPSQEVEE